MNTNHNDQFSIFITSKNSKEQIKKVQIGELISNEKSSDLDSLCIEKDQVKQEILGFGGAFTESSSSIYKSLNPEKKKEIIQFTYLTNCFTVIKCFTFCEIVIISWHYQSSFASNFS